MIKTKEFEKALNCILEVNKFQDYCPNGLQIEASASIRKVVFGVSASLELIQKAIELNADAIVVHHGYFWKNEKPQITDVKAKRIQALMKNNINLFGYHLPLDAHLELGNNAQLAKILGIKNPTPINDSFIWRGDWGKGLDDLARTIEKKLKRKPMVIQAKDGVVNRIAWCTGGAQNFLEQLIEQRVIDVYISGEISENTTLIARESKINYIAAGHHATERYGIQALCEKVRQDFDLECIFIDIDNPA